MRRIEDGGKGEEGGGERRRGCSWCWVMMSWIRLDEVE